MVSDHQLKSVMIEKKFVFVNLFCFVALIQKIRKNVNESVITNIVLFINKEHANGVCPRSECSEGICACMCGGRGQHKNESTFLIKLDTYAWARYAVCNKKTLQRKQDKKNSLCSQGFTGRS